MSKSSVRIKTMFGRGCDVENTVLLELLQKMTQIRRQYNNVDGQERLEAIFTIQS